MNHTRAIPGLQLGFLLSTLLTPAAVLGQASGLTAIEAGKWVDAEGKLRDGGVLVLENGAIKQIGGDVPAGVAVDRYAGAVLCPGLIDCNAALGALGGLHERDNAVQPRVRARDAFDRFSSQLQAALAAGVTTFALVPDDENLVGGRIAICRISGPERKPRILSDAGPLKLSIAPAAFKTDREPTSRGGAIGLLRETLEAARSAGNANDALGAFAAGRLSGFFATPSGADVLSAVEFADKLGLKLALVHMHDARDVAAAAAGHVAGVIVGPLDLAASRRDAEAPGLFERHGVKVALAGGLPTQPADSLRIGAAVAARAGLTPAAARRAITTVPAELLGVAEQIGVIDKGRQADLVVFSGDPLDLRSRVLAVYVSGQRVYFADAKRADGE